ncbi:MAG: tetratricopeptide repeat protein [Caldilineaceae bacterium]|nr:tetratricopeptide repeat protein [Caldilineaceae bacterium]
MENQHPDHPDHTAAPSGSGPRAKGDLIAAGIGPDAHNVVVGKNIIQIGALKIPKAIAWLLAVGLIIGLAAVGFIARNTFTISSAVTAPTPTTTPTVATATPTATPLAFATATTGETLILIATFHNTAVTNAEVHKKIQRAIEAEAARHGEQSLRVAIEPAVLAADQRIQAETLGERYNASMVIWGEDTGVEVIVNFLHLRESTFAAAWVTISETERTQLANPPAYAQFITDDLPRHLSFLALLAIGQSYYTHNAHPQAAVAIEAAIAALGDSVKPAELVDAYYRLCWLYQHSSLGNLAASIANCSKAVELKPDYAEAYNNRGSAYNAQNKWEEAIVDFTKVIELRPDLAAIAYYNLGVVYKAQNKPEAAITEYTTAIAFDPSLVLAYNNRCAAYVSLIKPDEAIADCDKAIELQPENAIAFNLRGNAHFVLRKLDSAIIDFNRAIELEPRFAAAYSNRGNAYANLNRSEEAIADFNKALTFDPGLAEIYISRGHAYASQDKLHEAMSDFHYYLSLQPDTELRPQVEQWIAELEAKLAKRQ